jgi:ankyrin repeat protein
VNKETNEGCTPLYIAAFKGHSSVVALLLEVDGVDVNKADNEGWAPLYIAARNGHSSVVELLLEVNGVDVNKAKIVFHFVTFACCRRHFC